MAPPSPIDQPVAIAKGTMFESVTNLPATMFHLPAHFTGAPLIGVV